MGTETALTEAARHFRERVHVHDARPDLREVALGFIGVREVELLRDGDSEYGVTEKLETLVGGQTTVLVRIRAVRQRQGEQ